MAVLLRGERAPPPPPQINPRFVVPLLSGELPGNVLETKGNPTSVKLKTSTLHVSRSRLKLSLIGWLPEAPECCVHPYPCLSLTPRMAIRPSSSPPRPRIPSLSFRVCSSALPSFGYILTRRPSLPSIPWATTSALPQ